MSDGLCVPDTRPTPRMRPFRDILADDRKNLEAMEEYASRVKRDGPLQPKSRIPLHGYRVSPQEEEVLQTRFSTQYPRLLEPLRNQGPITWTHVLLESLKRSDFIAKENGLYQCQVQGASIQVTSQDLEEILNELGICRRVITEPYSDAAESETRQEVAGCVAAQMESLLKRYNACQSILDIVNGPSKPKNIGAKALPTPAVSATDDGQSSPGAAQESRNIRSACLPPKTRALPALASGLRKRSRRSGNGVDVRPDTHPVPRRENVPETGSEDSSSDDESTGGDIPHDFGRRRDTAILGSSRSRVGSMEHRETPRDPGHTNRTFHHEKPAKKSRLYSCREMDEAKPFLMKLVAMGSTESEVEEAYMRKFNAIRSVHNLLEKFELGHLQSELEGNAKVRNRRRSDLQLLLQG
ncbi:uncharacterized protein N7506_002850 [Penicillium brevicompactum]|uniref:uncharacterized protein n=1 Tax=Penicillium brevicompactum TaxID=5074 RepID=UPI00253F91C5|nr:uncharacterized protein N7506_002850 [Penicillium brevicompactum]KAJ5343026.1 hypothetical protein N7506_002850 [Penicillium brevicompactum]